MQRGLLKIPRTGRRHVQLRSQRVWQLGNIVRSSFQTFQSLFSAPTLPSEALPLLATRCNASQMLGHALISSMGPSVISGNSPCGAAAVLPVDCEIWQQVRLGKPQHTGCCKKLSSKELQGLSNKYEHILQAPGQRLAALPRTRVVPKNHGNSPCVAAAVHPARLRNLATSDAWQSHSAWVGQRLSSKNVKGLSNKYEHAENCLQMSVNGGALWQVKTTGVCC